MPEGDTIHRAARRLAAALDGQTVTSVHLPRLVERPPAPGTVVESVEARGKYLLVHFDDRSVLETHMKMTGSWHLYRVGERWRRARSRARAVVATADWVAVCFDAPHIRLIHPERGPKSRRAAGGIEHLGPDLTGPDPDRGEIRDRLAAPEHARRPLIDVVLDQRLFCGVGNVFANEVLWACGHHPLVPLSTVSDDERDVLIDTAHRQLRANLGRGRRRTLPGLAGPDVAVYGREGRPCPRCGGPIAAGPLGRHQRPTFWCPSCQPEPTPSVGTAPQPGPSAGGANGPAREPVETDHEG